MGGSDMSTEDYAAVTVESSQARIHGEYSPARVRAGLRKRSNWEQLVRFCVVGGSGYVVNLAVFAFLLEVVGLHYISAAVGSFLVAVTNNYTWNRLWTFRSQRGGVAVQGARFFLVSTLALLANLASSGRSDPGANRPRRARGSVVRPRRPGTRPAGRGSRAARREPGRRCRLGASEDRRLARSLSTRAHHRCGLSLRDADLARQGVVG
jgi:hypothetical protein